MIDDLRVDFSLRSSSSSLFADINAISIPEKKADSNKQIRMPKIIT